MYSVLNICCDVWHIRDICKYQPWTCASNILFLANRLRYSGKRSNLKQAMYTSGVNVLGSFDICEIAKKGRLDILKYIYNSPFIYGTLHISGEDYSDSLNDAFTGACQGGHLHIIIWILQLYIRLYKDTDEPMIDIGDRLSIFIENGHTHIIRYLYRTGIVGVENSTISSEYNKLRDNPKLAWLFDNYIREKSTRDFNQDDVFLAFQHKQYGVMRYLLHIGVNINSGWRIFDYIDADTPLPCVRLLSRYMQHIHYSNICKFGRLDILRFICKRFPVRPHFINAFRYGHLSMVKYIIRKGFSQDLVYDLLSAVDYNQLHIVRYLVEECGIDIFQSCLRHLSYHLPISARLGETCLYNAASSGHYELVEYFIQLGVNIHVNNDTILFVAVSKNHISIVETLIRHGAKVTSANNRCITAAHYNHYLDMERLLARHRGIVQKRRTIVLDKKPTRDWGRDLPDI